VPKKVTADQKGEAHAGVAPITCTQAPYQGGEDGRRHGRRPHRGHPVAQSGGERRRAQAARPARAHQCGATASATGARRRTRALYLHAHDLAGHDRRPRLLVQSGGIRDQSRRGPGEAAGRGSGWSSRANPAIPPSTRATPSGAAPPATCSTSRRLESRPASSTHWATQTRRTGSRRRHARSPPRSLASTSPVSPARPPSGPRSSPAPSGVRTRAGVRAPLAMAW
jgi:hypothetical protein